MIIALAISLIIVNYGSTHNDIPTANQNNNARNIINSYQDQIDADGNPEKQALLYIDRAYELSQFAEANDGAYCNQIIQDLEAAKALSSSEEIQLAADAIITICIPAESSSNATVKGANE